MDSLLRSRLVPVTAAWSVFLVFSGAFSGAGEPSRALPAPPGRILDLRANAAGDLYVRTATNVLHLALYGTDAGWRALALDRVVDLSENAGREVFARRDLKTRFAFHRLSGTGAVRVATAPNVTCERWYVDAVGRVWIQTKERLLVVEKDRTLLDRPTVAPGYGYRFREPCEWQPGHVVLFYGNEAVWATPQAVVPKAAPPFADDGTGTGPFRMGTDLLVAGGCNNKGMGSFLLDPREPGKPPERAKLGWNWFQGIATAPDGRVLVLAQTDRNPQFTLFWYAADGRSDVRLKGAENVIRAGHDRRALIKARVAFAATGVAYAVVPNGMLAEFRPDEAFLLTPGTGLPLPRVEHLAVVGDDLVLADDEQLLVWRTTEPLKPAVAFDDRREWPLAGPCVRDVNGTMWAFLLDFPGKLSRHDGERWRHFDIELGNRIPSEMTGDDKGRLQIAFGDAPSGSTLVTDGIATNWPNEPVRAWSESVLLGATWFGDGSPFRPRHVAAGRGNRIWTYNGRSLWNGELNFDYYESPPYRAFWLGPDGRCYRGGSGRLWVYAQGRWTEAEPPPLSIGPDGVRAVGAGEGRALVIYERQLKLPLPVTLEPASRAGARSLPLQGNEAFIPAGGGGGWVGQYRAFRDAHYRVAGRVYPGTNGSYLVADKTLRFQPPRELSIEGEVITDGKLRRLVCRIDGSESPHAPRLLAFLDGEFNPSIVSPDGVDLPSSPPGPHELQVYAADGFGVVGRKPLRLPLEGGPEIPVSVFELDDAWTLKPRRLQRLPTDVGGRNVLGRDLDIDADGVVWILVEGGVIAIESANRQASFHRFPAQELLSARGRVWARGPHVRERLRMPVYELRRDGVRHAVDLYDDSTYATRQLAADGAGGIWAISHRAAVRWDGQGTQCWEREIGYAVVLPLPDGAVLRCPGDCYVYRDGQLGSAIRWSSGDAYADTPLYTLGRSYLVMPRRGAIVALDDGRTLDRKSPPGESFRTDAAGNLYVWNKGQLSRLSGQDLAETRLAACPSPSAPPLHDPGGYGFVAATNGVVMYTVGADRLTVVRSDEGVAEYGWREGILAGPTTAMREAPDGRIWILRRAQLLVYDPAQPADAVPRPWAGWRGVPVVRRFGTGAFGHVWYRDTQRRAMICSDGTNETSWAMNDGYGEVIVSDQGVAAVFSGPDTYILVPGEKVVREKDQKSAVLELVRRGGKRFEGDAPPAVAADGRVYFRGRIWDGQTWHRAPTGRASLDPRGELYLLCGGRSAPLVVYRIDGVEAIPMGQATQCLLDACGLRWYDPGLMEADPGCLPVWHGGKDGPELSSDMATTRTKINRDASLQALPLGDGRFLVRIGAGLHLLDGQGLTPLPADAVPCGNAMDPTWGLNVWPLADGRWAFASADGTVFISPPDLRPAGP